MVKDIKIALFNFADYAAPCEHPSLGLGYIVSFLQKGLGIKSARILAGDVLSKMERDPPDIIGISSVTQDFIQATQCARILKEKFPVPIIVGGVHVSSLPRLLPEVFDLAVLGEGEETMRELIETISVCGFDKKHILAIKGIAYHHDGRVVVNPARELIADMDSIPFPVRGGFHRKGFFHLLTSRGCPYRCSFCSSSLFWNKVRFFSPQYVVDEMKYLVDDLGARHISIWDDIFIANRARFEEIVELIKRENLHRKASFGCSVRANLVTPKVCSLMKSMNITHVDMGLESGSNRMLKYLKKDSVDVAANKLAVELLQQHGFVTRGSFIIGSPDETAADMLETLEFIKTSRLDGGVVNVAVPYPGTELWKYASGRGLVGNDMDFAKLAIVTKISELSRRGFLLLSDRISRGEFIELGSKIEAELNRRNARSLFSRRNLNLRNFVIALFNPRFTLKLIQEALAGWFRNLIKRS